MKVAILSESSADEAAIRILIDAILPAPSEPADLPPLRSRGWGSFVNVLGPVIKHLHYHSDADAFAVIADSDDSRVHVPEHRDADPECRSCILKREVNRIRATLSPRPHKPPLQICAATAVPSIEAWLLVQEDVHITELSWIRALQSRQFPYTRKTLKQRLYGADRVSLEREKEVMSAAARRLTTDLERLENRFPNTFAAFAREVRAWGAPPTLHDAIP